MHPIFPSRKIGCMEDPSLLNEYLSYYLPQTYMNSKFCYWLLSTLKMSFSTTHQVLTSSVFMLSSYLFYSKFIITNHSYLISFIANTQFYHNTYIFNPTHE
uniref:Uncharacterized protein n=1 Tax=Cacopsylla melanoneura TaxID=428564 RepID=A0A8D8TKF4_9HEMI